MKSGTWFFYVFLSLLIVALLCFVAKEVGVWNVHSCATNITVGNTFTGCQAFGCPEGTNIVASKTSNKYHLCDCAFADRIKQENMICIKTIADAEALGYVGCSVCIS